MFSLRIIFAGTPDFAALSLQALLGSQHQVVAVLTQPDRPSGRGKKLTPGPVKALSRAHGVPVLQPLELKEAGIQQQLAAYQADVMVVVAYGLLIPQSVLDMPRYGCINVHASLLPRWRGAAPIQRAIEAGDSETGVGIMQIEVGLDTGPVLLEKRTPISPDDTGATVHDRLAELGADALLEALSALPALQSNARIQSPQGVTYAHKLSKEDALLNWQDAAQKQINRIRAFNPWPVAWTTYNKAPIKIWQARLATGTGIPGETLAVTDDSIVVATADGAIAITRLQLPDKKAMSVADMLRGRADYFVCGERFGE